MEAKLAENIEINGVVLTQKCLGQLNQFQNEKNNYLLEQIVQLGEISDYLSKRLFGGCPAEEEDTAYTARLIANLAFLKDHLRNLSNPA